MTSERQERERETGERERATRFLWLGDFSKMTWVVTKRSCKFFLQCSWPKTQEVIKYLTMTSKVCISCDPVSDPCCHVHNFSGFIPSFPSLFSEFLRISLSRTPRLIVNLLHPSEWDEHIHFFPSLLYESYSKNPLLGVTLFLSRNSSLSKKLGDGSQR